MHIQAQASSHLSKCALQDCGKPFYQGNYVAFASALRIAYPHLRLIANCDMASAAPQDLYDWHWYTDENGMFAGRYTFDTFPRSSPVFVSEYAVYDHGILTKPWGNLGVGGDISRFCCFSHCAHANLQASCICMADEYYIHGNLCMILPCPPSAWPA